MHAEGFMAGELKHGPLAMVDDKCVLLARSSHLQCTELPHRSGERSSSS